MASLTLRSALNFQTMMKVLPTEGQIVYEYNPLRNYRCTRTMFEYNGDYYTLAQLESKFGITPSEDKTTWLKDGVANADLSNDITLYEPGQLMDFITDELSFSLDHPVNILPQYSYDGSVNLILNDGISYPKLINSRFSATGQNTYEIVDRKGDNDTNIYDQGEQFPIDTSLFKVVNNIPKLEYRGTQSGGNLKVGNYHFYLKLSDADGNETDYVAESGLVSVFIGFSNPSSITSGTKNENSYKSVQLYLSNIDLSYNYVTVYYSRYTAQGQENLNIEYKKIDKKFNVTNSGTSTITITGYERTLDTTFEVINDGYELVDAAKTQADCANMLFLGNVHKQDIPYDELTDLSLRFLPYLAEKEYQCDMDENYLLSSGDGYYSSEFIYKYTGYWNEELYRFGIVYILPNGQLTPVFNIRGNLNVTTDTIYSYYPIGSKVNYTENDYLVLTKPGKNGELNTTSSENVKGVVRLMSTRDTNIIHSFTFKADKEVIQELSNYAKGFFFVRQTRIPTILAQGVTMGVDQESHVPTIATAEGVLSDLADSLDGSTHVETSDINDVNYISEGFLHRYSFHFKKKHSGLFSSILKGVVIGVAVVGLAAATVFTAGAVGAAVAGASLAGAVSAGAGAVVSAAAAVGATVGLAGAAASVAVSTAVPVATALVMTSIAVAQEIRYGFNRVFATKKLDGRNTTCPSGYKIVEDDESRTITHTFNDRIIIKDSSKNKVQAILCPDFEVNQAYFNQLFTGNTHKIGLTISQSTNALMGHSSNYFTNNGRHFFLNSYYDMGNRSHYNLPIISVPDNTKCVGLNNYKFRSRAGYAEEAYRYECVGDDYKSEYTKSNDTEDDETISNKKINADIIRGSFGPYLGIASDANNFSPAETVNIYIPNYSEGNMMEYLKIRMGDSNPYYAVSDRLTLKDYLGTNSLLVGEDNSTDFELTVYRGDCYICQFTHRLIRNFQDPSAPYNDDIVDENTWRDHYDPENTEEYENINLGDVNAVQLGMWVTFRIRSPYNLNIRTLDGSYVDETQMTGHPRGYYPYQPMSVDGNYKVPDSQVYNKGFSKSVSQRVNALVPDVPYIKNWFGTRVMYSDLHINDAYKNGYRVFRRTRSVDFTRQYGEITKILALGGYLLIVFEHGVAMSAVNEKNVQEVAGKLIATSKVLSDTPTILSNTYGSQWADSIIKTPKGVYGVDTVAKKIWFTNGSALECISDMRVQEFLNNNITLGERELTPKLGIRNVKSFYNAYKADVMFTFYDNTYGFEEKVWNLCWSETLSKFITFYSWVPSYMENIYNVPFSFNRDTSKWIAKLGTSHADNSFADGITLSNVVVKNLSSETNSKTATIKYLTKQGTTASCSATVIADSNFIGLLDLENRVLPSSDINYNITYSLKRDSYGNYKNFEIKQVQVRATVSDAKQDLNNFPRYGLFYKPASDLTKAYLNNNGTLESVYTSNGAVYLQTVSGAETLISEMYYRNKKGHSYADYDENKIRIVKFLTQTEIQVADYANNLSTMELKDYLALPIFKNKKGQRPTLTYSQQYNQDKIVTLLNISADISYQTKPSTVDEAYYNNSAVNYGSYESVVAIMPEWNMQFLSTDFWRHGQAGIIDIADKIYPTYWYGKQHPFEFEFIVVNDPSMHKIFTNLELVANKAKPESFHYEVVGEAYDFAKDKINMYFRQEALKALWQYNGADVTYNRDFLDLQLKQQNKSADLPHSYYARKDTINEIEDSYVEATTPKGSDYRHLSGAEIVYYENRQEFRIWNHVRAVDIADQPDTTASKYGGRGLIASNMRYLEDRWKVQINPILVCYKNEFKRLGNGALCTPENSTWVKSYDGSTKLPPLTIYNSPIPDKVLETGLIEMPDETIGTGSDNALYELYDKDSNYLDTTNWLNDVGIYNYNFGNAQNRKEVNVRDKFVKIRIRYSGEELAVIDFINTVYQVSFA